MWLFAASRLGTGNRRLWWCFRCVWAVASTAWCFALLSSVFNSVRICRTRVRQIHADRAGVERRGDDGCRYGSFMSGVFALRPVMMFAYGRFVCLLYFLTIGSWLSVSLRLMRLLLPLLGGLSVPSVMLLIPAIAADRTGHCERMPVPVLSRLTDTFFHVVLWSRLFLAVAWSLLWLAVRWKFWLRCAPCCFRRLLHSCSFFVTLSWPSHWLAGLPGWTAAVGVGVVAVELQLPWRCASTVCRNRLCGNPRGCLKASAPVGDGIGNPVQTAHHPLTSPGHCRWTCREAHSEFEHVDFCCEVYRPLLNGFNLAIRPGEKSVWSDAAARSNPPSSSCFCALYEPQSGTVLIDGAGHKRRCPESLRAQIGLVS